VNGSLPILLFLLAFLIITGVSTVFAGKSPECVGNCGRELSETECFDRCNQISALFVNEILECQNNCADEIAACQDLCLEYNQDCVENCPERSE